eukprot:TRINITY_DN2315_c0_g1_i2.p1 TRINITY_DN2315_c0_g1~~TRINITY_DN2315_c0_g1_i2.p1  ORF type:complete len:535 (+),score=103.15 TRINITY_DN2315_c0_g1_i2:55-1659(+)
MLRTCGLVLTAMSSAVMAADKPHIIMILQDDMGMYDVGFNNKAAASYTSNITSLATDGVVLTNHYTHWHCSPTRRSFLSGRLPIHHGEQLSGVTTDDIDLRMTWISKKMKSAGYETHWFGKGHTGYESMNHLAVKNGFDSYFGYLTGAQDYTSNDKWQGIHPALTDAEWTNRPESCHPNTYSSELYGDLAVRAVAEHDTTKPFFMYLAFQAVHEPYNPVPGNPEATVYQGMLWDADVNVGKLVAALKENNNMYDNTLIVYSSDNGGVVDGNNYPLRGEKHSNWEGGMRTATFVSGGYVPEGLRGTKNDINLHIVDWYPTFCHLAGVDETDNPPVPPLPVDPSNPEKNIYGDDSFPPLDGTNVWDMILNRKDYNISSAHAELVLSKEVIIVGEYKLLVAQPYFKTQNNGWKQPNGTWIESLDSAWPCNHQDLPPTQSHLPGNGLVPCLFNLRGDSGEHVNLASSNMDLVNELWGKLNNTILTTRDCSGWTGPIPGPDGKCSPAALIGKCNKTCADQKWNSYGKGSGGPLCDVPGC